MSDTLRTPPALMAGSEPTFLANLRRYITTMGVRPERKVGITGKQLLWLEHENMLDTRLTDDETPVLWGQPLAVVIHDVDD